MGGVMDFEARARERLSGMAWDYYDSGAMDERTLRRNQTAYDELELQPKVLRDVSSRSKETTVLGRALSSPLFVAPAAFQRLAHDEGEQATARAASRSGVGMVLSTLTTVSPERVAGERTDYPQWFQLYVHRDRGLTRELVARVEELGFEALCVTVDAPLLGRRERDEANAFALPEHMNLEAFAGLQRERVESSGQGSGLFAYFLQQIDPALNWDSLEWLASISNLPIIPKGIMHPEDAVRAADFGASAVIVSNHGGRQLDTTVPTIEALPGIVDALRDQQVEVLVDGGIRRGTDILKALARGAQAVLIARPVLWGLACDGADGVFRVLELFKDELDLAMALSGCARLSDIDESLIYPSKGR